MEKILIDILGSSIGVFTAVMLFETIWVRRKIAQQFFIGGVIINIALSVASTVFLLNATVLPVIVLVIIFALSLFYVSSIAIKILFSFIVLAVLFAAEMFISLIMLQLTSIPLEQMQTNIAIYLFGVLASKLLALLAVLVFRVFRGSNKQYSDKQSDVLIAFMPLQAIILCYVVLVTSVIPHTIFASPLGISVVFLSILLIFITMIILNKQQKAMLYKNKFELEQVRLKMQIEHYREVYQEQQRIMKMRHDMSSNLIAISGTLKAGQTQEAIDRIDGMQESVIRPTYVVDTGYPPIDAILSTKISRAKEHDINVGYTVIIDNELHVDQFDIAVVIANAMDNAIEGIRHSTDIKREVTLSIMSVADYISILIENYASGLIHEDFKTTKPDSKNHGFGMAQMEEITRKYNGSFIPSYDSETMRFSLKVMLENQQLN